MIRHTIIKYKTKVYEPFHHVMGSPPSQRSLEGPARNPNRTFAGGPEQFKTLTLAIDRFKIGDFCTICGEANTYPYKQEDLWKIKNLCTLWYTCYVSESGRLLTTLLENKAGVTRWVNHNGIIKTAFPHLEW